MSLPQAVAEYVIAESVSLAFRGGDLTWSAAVSISEASRSLRRLAAVCFAERVSIDDALIAHAPDFVRAQAERWRGMVDLLEPVKAWAPEPIVILGPWRQHPSGTWYRLHHGTRVEGATVKHGGWALRPNLPDVWPAIVRGDGDKDDADREARERGWVLLDAEPLAQPRTLGPWVKKRYDLRERFCSSVALYASVGIYWDGWRVNVGYMTLAHGPQTDSEGERLAMAAALALGFVEGAQ